MIGTRQKRNGSQYLAELRFHVALYSLEFTFWAAKGVNCVSPQIAQKWFICVYETNGTNGPTNLETQNNFPGW